MSELKNLEAGSRHDLRFGISPDAPDVSQFQDEADGAFGWAHSYETASRYDGPGLRVVLFVSGCPLRCQYCHNPDTWHLKDGTYISAQQVIDRLGGFASALGALDGGLTISGGEPLVQLAFTRRIFAAAKQMGLHTAIETSGYLGDRVDDNYLSNLDLVLLDIKSSDPDTYKKVTSRELAPTLRFAERLAAMGKRVWVRFHDGAGTHRRSGKRRRYSEVCRPHEECRVGGGTAVPSAWRIQVEGAEPRLQARQHPGSYPRPCRSSARTIPCSGLQRPLIPHS